MVPMSRNTPRRQLTGAELQARMEDNFYLIEGLAAYLRVNNRKLRQMMQDERPIPEGFTTELDQLTRITTQIINKLITSTEENQHRHIPVWRTDAEFHTADIPLPVPPGAGARWWRHVAHQAAQATGAQLRNIEYKRTEQL